MNHLSVEECAQDKGGERGEAELVGGLDVVEGVHLAHRDVGAGEHLGEVVHDGDQIGIKARAEDATATVSLTNACGLRTTPRARRPCWSSC